MIRINTDLCAICSQCIVVCPKEAIKGWGFPVVEQDKCIECYTCWEYCPTGAIEIVKEEKSSE